ncbi:MAG: hypothetical protein WCO95_06850, partial [Actinomycetes bacterium]
MSSSHEKRVVRGEPDEKGWASLYFGAGEELIGTTPLPSAKPILSLIHISDLHICDAQSPARVELMDRFADPH